MNAVNWDGGAPTHRRISETISSNEVIAPSDDKKQYNTNEARVKKVSPVSGNSSHIF